jgi:Ca-activated chloride channel family protein
MRFYPKGRAAMALVLAGMSGVAAQQPPTFSANTDLVLVPVSVTDRRGRFVHGLTADDFEILDGRMPRPVTQFSAAPVPVSLGILLDISGSMMEGPDASVADDARWGDTRRALELLLARRGAADEILFAVFNDQLAASPWTLDHRRILDVFDSLRPGGGTALLQAIRAIAPAFRTALHQRKVLLLISDGNDTQTPAAGLLPPEPYEIGDTTAHVGDSQRTRRGNTIAASREAIRKSDAMLYAIGTGTRKGTRVDMSLLDDLTRESGGYAEPLRSASDIPAAVARICDDLRSQYIMAFEPVHADGKYHAIRVRTKDTRLKVRARAGYFARPVTP